MPHIGVKNRTEKEQTLTFDGKNYVFGPTEIRILEGVPHTYIMSRYNVEHNKTKDKDGKDQLLPTLSAKQLFEVIPLEEALKVAKPEEDPLVVEMRKQEQEKAKERAKLINEIKTGLLADGWAPPEGAKKVGRPRKNDEHREGE